MYRNIDAIFICFSTESVRSLDEALEQFKHAKQMSASKIYILVGLKTDIRDQTTKEGDPEYFDRHDSFVTP